MSIRLDPPVDSSASSVPGTPQPERQPGAGGGAPLDSVIASAGLSATRHTDAETLTWWSECAHGGWIVEGPAAAVVPHVRHEAVVGVSPHPDGTVWLHTAAHPNGRPTTTETAKRVALLVHRSRSPRQRAEMLISTLPGDGRPGHFGVRNDGMFAGRWLFRVAPQAPRWPSDAPDVISDAQPGVFWGRWAGISQTR